MSIEINKETLDYLSDQLADAVKGSVEVSIFKTYRNTAATVLAVLAAVGVTVGWPTIRSVIEERVKVEVATEVKEPVLAAQALAEKARAAADRAATEADLRREQIGREMANHEAKIDDFNAKAAAIEQRTDKANAEITAHIASNKVTIDGLDQRAQSIDLKFTSVGVTDEIASQVKSLAEQVAKLFAAFKSLANVASHPEIVASAGGVGDEASKIGARLETIQKAANVQQTDADNKAVTTVFVQFAGGSRAQVAQIIGPLAKTGTFVFPGAERTEAADGHRDIRYFYGEDAAAATALRTQINDTLKQLGYSIQIDSLSPDWLKFHKKPQRGVLELWLEVPLRSSAG